MLAAYNSSMALKLTCNACVGWEASLISLW